MKIRWALAVLALAASASPYAQDQPQPQDQPPAQQPPAQQQPEPEPDVIPVFEGSDDDLESLAPDWEWTVSGNLQGDLLGSSDLPKDREDTSEVRRARISGLLEWREDWRLKLGIDLVQKDSPYGRDILPLRDLSVEYRGLPVYFEAGQFVEPFGLLQSSSRGAGLMERPQALGLAPGYGLGAAANARFGDGGFSLGLFGPTRNDVFFGGREDSSITMRATYVPLHSDDALLHVGAALSERKPVDGFLQFVTIPESVLLLGLNTSSQRLIADRYRLLGLELAGQLGPVLLQAEAIRADVAEALSFDDFFQNGTFTFLSPSYTGAYLEADWAVTGERRDYSVRRGTFSGIEPRTSLLGGGLGAIELAARYGSTDLRDDNGRGERGRIASAGINWYPIEYAKVMLEALEVTDDSAGGREKVRAVQMRLQLHFTAP